MPATDFRPIPLDRLPSEAPPDAAAGLWDGFLFPGDITLLTSRWKTGKTTLLAGLLRALGPGKPFLGRPTRPARVWVVSEEATAVWAGRVRGRPVGPHVHLLARPFRGRPAPADWLALLDAAADARAAGGLDLLVVDPLASFLPGRCESDAASLLDALHPLHALTAAGAAVLLLHHPRKGPAEAGSAARGSGALLGFVDVAVELTRYSQLGTDAHRRLLTAEGRRPGVPARLAYELDPADGGFRAVADPGERQFTENWAAVDRLLRGRREPATCREVLRDWPVEVPPPSESTLYRWLAHAAATGLVRREGRGTRDQPWRYRTPGADPGSGLPPLPGLG
jgi:hypothetical protein